MIYKFMIFMVLTNDQESYYARSRRGLTLVTGIHLVSEIGLVVNLNLLQILIQDGRVSRAQHVRPK